MQKGEGERRGKGAGSKRFMFYLEMEKNNYLTLADKLKPIRATVLLVKEFLAVGELSCLASFAFW